MSITCLLSQTVNDLRCPVCGQGFLVFAEHTSATVREQVRRRVQGTMRMHHAGAEGSTDVHPTLAFAVAGEDDTVAGRLSGWQPDAWGAAWMG